MWSVATKIVTSDIRKMLRVMSVLLLRIFRGPTVRIEVLPDSPLLCPVLFWEASGRFGAYSPAEKRPSQQQQSLNNPNLVYSLHEFCRSGNRASQGLLE